LVGVAASADLHGRVAILVVNYVKASSSLDTCSTAVHPDVLLQPSVGAGDSWGRCSGLGDCSGVSRYSGDHDKYIQ